jgi:hypothetical protein
MKEKIKSFLRSFGAVLIVMLGTYLMGFYIKNEISFTSVFCGIIGFFILFPAIKKWDQMLGGPNAN